MAERATLVRWRDGVWSGEIDSGLGDPSGPLPEPERLLVTMRRAHAVCASYSPELVEFEMRPTELGLLALRVCPVVE